MLPDGRLCEDWLTTYLRYNDEHEAPESLHKWTGLCVLSAAVRRQVYIELQFGATKRVYPNIYVIIVAESAKVRKSAAMDAGRDLLFEALPSTRIMRDSMTSQGLIKSMNHKVQVVDEGKIKEIMRSDVAIFADEVANLFSYDKLRAAQMVILLTRSYECPSVYDHTTARDSTIRLHNLYPVLLGGTDPSNLKVLPPEAVGGLTGRLIWIIENQKRLVNSGWKRNQHHATQQTLIRECLMRDLQRIAKLHGEMHVKPEAMDMYDKWYEELSKRDTRDPESDAFYHRCHTTALRLSILLSISESDSMVVTSQHMIEAIRLIEGLLPAVKRVIMWNGGSQFEQHRAKLINYLQKSNAGIALRRNTLAYVGITASEFDELCNTLAQSETIRCFTVAGNAVIQLVTEKRDAKQG